MLHVDDIKKEKYILIRGELAKNLKHGRGLRTYIFGFPTKIRFFQTGFSIYEKYGWDI